MKIDVKAGHTYFLCTCARSHKHPLCDGSHKGSGKKPVHYHAEKNGVIEFSGEEEVIQP